jgi:DNA-directed RNA polymerase specialized sigma24 family protein
MKKQRRKEENEGSPYWDWYHGREQFGEPLEANPDVSSERFWKERFTDSEQELLQEIRGMDLRNVLDPLEQSVLKMTMNDVPRADICRLLDISKKQVTLTLKSAGSKLRKHLKVEE